MESIIGQYNLKWLAEKAAEDLKLKNYHIEYAEGQKDGKWVLLEEKED